MLEKIASILAIIGPVTTLLSLIVAILTIYSLIMNAAISEKDATIEQLNVRIDSLLNKYEESLLQKCSNISNITEIKIISPEKGDKIKGYSVVRGIICGELPDKRYMWIVSNIESVPGSWWPQAGPVKPQSERWNGEAWLGLDKIDSGRSISIDVILVDENVNQVFTNYRKEGEKNHSYSAIPFPANATIMDSITVTRV